MTTAERIKRAVQLDELVARLDFSPNRAGYISCPAHSDSTPSLKIYGGDRGWFCFSCQTGGTVIDFYMHTLGVDLSTALKELSDLYGIDTNSELSPDIKADRYQRKRKVSEAELLQQEADHWWSEVVRYRDILNQDHTEMTDELANACQLIAYAEYRWEVASERVRLKKRRGS